MPPAACGGDREGEGDNDIRLCCCEGDDREAMALSGRSDAADAERRMLGLVRAEYGGDDDDDEGKVENEASVTGGDDDSGWSEGEKSSGDAALTASARAAV